MQNYLTAYEVADKIAPILDVKVTGARRYVYEAIRQKKLKAEKLPGRRAYKCSSDAVQEYIDKWLTPVPVN